MEDNGGFAQIQSALLGFMPNKSTLPSNSISETEFTVPDFPPLHTLSVMVKGAVSFSHPHAYLLSPPTHLFVQRLTFIRAPGWLS